MTRTRPLTVVVCTHNPRDDYLLATLSGLQKQCLGLAEWDLLIVDNASSPPIANRVDLSWHPRARVVREEQLGLSYARLRSFDEAAGEVFVYLDDDNVVDADYLSSAQAAMSVDPSLGAAGGKSVPCYEEPPPPWFEDLDLTLACRDLGDQALYGEWNSRRRDERTYPACSPIGAGLVIRRTAYETYIRGASDDKVRTSLGRRGAYLASGEDNDIIMSVLEGGWRVAYLPQLRLVHLIPARRLTREYLARYARDSNRTWVQALDIHGIRPWPPIPAWSLQLRKLKAFVTSRAWASDASYVRWRASCGLLEGQALLRR